MNYFRVLCCAVVLLSSAFPIHAERGPALRLVQTLPLPGVSGRLDHMAVDVEKRRLFVAAVANGTIEVLDLDAGKAINSIPGIKDAQDAPLSWADFLTNLYVSSLDGTLRIFQGETFRLIQALKLEPDPNRLLYDPATDLIYFGYGGQNAGFDAYERVGVLQATRGARSDQFVADMIAPTFRPGHLAEMALDDRGRLLACDSRADLIFQFDSRKRELLKSWPAHGDGAGDMSLDRVHHRLFVGTRIPAEMTVYDSGNSAARRSGRCQGPVDHARTESTTTRNSSVSTCSGGRWYGTPEASPGWVFVYQQRDGDHYELISKIKTRPGSGDFAICTRPQAASLCGIPGDRRSGRRHPRI